jgi:hypothetical protein
MTSDTIEATRPCSGQAGRCGSTEEVRTVEDLGEGRERVTVKCAQCRMRRSSYERQASDWSRHRWDTRRQREIEMRDLGMTVSEWSLHKARQWSDSYGSPPSAYDWNLTAARTKFAPEKLAEAESRHEEHVWPSASTIQSRFGSWNGFLEEAGFQTMKPGVRRHGSGPRPNPEVERRRERVKELREQGLKNKEIAESIGIAPRTVSDDLNTLKRRGVELVR